MFHLMYLFYAPMCKLGLVSDARVRDFSKHNFIDVFSSRKVDNYMIFKYVTYIHKTESSHSTKWTYVPCGVSSSMQELYIHLRPGKCYVINS